MPYLPTLPLYPHIPWQGDAAGKGHRRETAPLEGLVSCEEVGNIPMIPYNNTLDGWCLSAPSLCPAQGWLQHMLAVARVCPFFPVTTVST